VEVKPEICRAGSVRAESSRHPAPPTAAGVVTFFLGRLSFPAQVRDLRVNGMMNTSVRVLLCVLALVGPARGVAQSQEADALGAQSAAGAAAMEAQRFDEAASIYEGLVTARPADAGLLMNLGMARYMAGHAEHAIAPLQKAVKLKPTLAPAALFLGASLLDVGRFKEAAAPLRDAVAAMPKNAEAREMLARATLALSDYPSAATHYRALTALDASSPKAWFGLARSYQGLAEDAFTALQQQAPESPMLELIVAEVAVTAGKFPAALSIYRRVLASGSPVGGVHEAVAELYERAGKPEWAAAELKRAPPRTPAACASKQAECLFLDGKFREALHAARGLNSPAGLYWTIRAANSLATESVARLETLPPSVELHLIRAEIAQAQGRRADAVSAVRSALALAPGDAAIEMALGEALVRANDLGQALPLLERLAREHPQDGSVLFMLGDALLLSQRIDDAIPVLERAVTANPGALAPRASLGRAYVQAGRFEAALPHLEAAALEDEDGDVHYQLARAYQALQRMDQAKLAMTEYQKRQAQQAPAEPAGGETEATLTPP
jgi:tetratricopeptide (TPR) repeat protein